MGIRRRECSGYECGEFFIFSSPFRRGNERVFRRRAKEPTLTFLSLCACSFLSFQLKSVSQQIELMGLVAEAEAKGDLSQGK